MDSNDLYRQINVKAGADCEVSPFCTLENVVLGDGVRIGEGTQLKNVVIGSGTKIGRRVTLYSPDSSRPVQLGKSCWLSEGVFGEATGGAILFGNYVVVAHHVLILTSSGPGAQSIVMNQLYPLQIGPIELGDHSWIGAASVLLPGTQLNEGIVIGANAVVPRGEYGPWSVYGGTPAKLIKRLSAEAVHAAKLTAGLDRSVKLTLCQENTLCAGST